MIDQQPFKKPELKGGLKMNLPIDQISYHKNEIVKILKDLPENYEDFDILNVPVSTWRNVFILDVKPDNELVVRLTGTAIEDGLGRGCHGLVFSEVVHGPRSDDVLQAFINCAEKGWSGIMCQAVKINDPERILSITAGIKRLYQGQGKRDIIFGLMYISYLPHEEYEGMGFASEIISEIGA